MRISEIFALRRSNVGFVNKKIHVERQIITDRGRYELTALKSKNTSLLKKPMVNNLLIFSRL